MKKPLLIFIVLLLGQLLKAQNFSINILPRYSWGGTIPNHYTIISGERFLNPTFKTKYAGVLINNNGDEIDYNQNSNGLGGEVMFKWTNSNSGNALGIYLGGYRHKYLKHAEYPPFNFKGSRLVGVYSFYRLTGISAGVRRVFMQGNAIGWYFQAGGLYGFQLQDFAGSKKRWEKSQAGTYRTLENGTGKISTVTNLQPRNLVLSPEIGITNRGDFGLDISVSYQLPIGKPLYTSTESYYRSNNLVGTEEVGITQQSVWLNIRASLSVLKRERKIRSKTVDSKLKESRIRESKKRTPKIPKEEKIKTSTVPLQKFQDLCITIVDEKKQQPVPNAEVVFEGKVMLSNNEGKILIVAQPIGKKIKFSVMANDYEEGDVVIEAEAQKGCQSLNVELTPLSTVPSVEINGQTVKKGESIILNALQFEQSKSDLQPIAKAELDKVASLMRKYPAMMIELSGHTSNEGDYDENVRLSKERVAICKRYLGEKVVGVQERITTIGYGSSRPKYPNNTLENRQKNRRVELKIVSF